MTDTAFTTNTARGSRTDGMPPRPAMARSTAPATGRSEPAVTAGARVTTGGRRAAPPPMSPGRAVRLPEIALGVLLVAGCALGALVWHRSTTSTTRALVLAKPVTRGSVLAPGDLTSAEVNTQGVLLTPFAEAASYVGRIATTDLSAGAPVTPDVLVEVVTLPDGQAVIGRKLEPGEFPEGLGVGMTVVVVEVVDPNSFAASALTPPDESSAGVRATNEPSPGVDKERLADSPAVESTTAVIESITVSEDGTGSVLATLRLNKVDAVRVAAAYGVRLVQVG